MKALLVLPAAAIFLGGCVAVPVEPAPGMYAPPPAVIVQPYVSYGGYYGGHYGGYYYRRAPYWRHRWH